MQGIVSRPDKPAAIRTDLGAVFVSLDHVRQRGGNSGLSEVAAGHAATVEYWVAIASVNGGVSSAIASVCM